MQVRIKQETKVFKPVTFEITFETQEEINLIENMLSWDVSIPEVVYTENPVLQASLGKIMQEIYVQIREVAYVQIREVAES